MVARLPGLQFLDEVLEHILDRGMVLDGMSHLVAVARNRSESVLVAFPYCPFDVASHAA